jgi:glucose-1-phosphate thymidylyltransferase
MKAVIPVAGEGTRFRPLTYAMPKALILVAGKPVLAHILAVAERWNASEAVLVVSPGQIDAYEGIRRGWSLPIQIAVQERPLGLGHAILQARPYVGEEPMVIVYGDTIVDADPADAVMQEADAVLGVQWHEDPRRFGIAELAGEKVIRLQEKPTEREPGLVIVGINYIANSSLLFDCLEELVRSTRQSKGEFQATDAFQLMVNRGAEVRTFPVAGWYDCGTPQSLLETQRQLIGERQHHPDSRDSIFVTPVNVHPEAEVEASVVGPFVTVGEAARICRSVVSDSVIHSGARIEGVVLEKSIVGSEARVTEQPASMVVAAHSTFARAGHAPVDLGI